VALTMREVCELTTKEIARAFLIPASTLAQCISAQSSDDWFVNEVSGIHLLSRIENGIGANPRECRHERGFGSWDQALHRWNFAQGDADNSRRALIRNPRCSFLNREAIRHICDKSLPDARDMAGIITAKRKLIAAAQGYGGRKAEAEQDADARSNPDGVPRIVANVLIGDGSRFLTLCFNGFGNNRKFILSHLQAFHDLRASIGSLFPDHGGSGFDKLLQVFAHNLEVFGKFFFGDGRNLGGAGSHKLCG